MTITVISIPSLLWLILFAWSIIQRRSLKSCIINEESAENPSADSSTSKKALWNKLVRSCLASLREGTVRDPDKFSFVHIQRSVFP